MIINSNILKLQKSYLFTEIAARTQAYEKAHPEHQVIKLGIGDVSRPIVPAIINTIHKYTDEMGDIRTFRGYGAEEGSHFLRQAIADNDYAPLGIEFTSHEVFISDGAATDIGNLCDIFGAPNKVAVLDPVYPEYIEVSVMAGRSGNFANGKWSDIVYLPTTAENNFCPEPPQEHVDIIYLCYPNNPTGTALTRPQLQRFVDYALEHEAVIIFDSAYEAYITSDEIPHSIYELPGAKECAIEIRSYSKTAGFTALRCSYTIVPKELMGRDSEGNKVSMNALWLRRQCTKYNGTSYLIQRAAEASYTPEGKAQIRANIDYYMENARNIRRALQELGYEVYGGEHAPYIWVKTPEGMGSWDMFDMLLNKYQIVTTPGVGFGPSGEGYIRFSAFNSHENTQAALQRLV